MMSDVAYNVDDIVLVTIMSDFVTKIVSSTMIKPLKTYSWVVLVVELVHEVELNSTVHDLCNEI